MRVSHPLLIQFISDIYTSFRLRNDDVLNETIFKIAHETRLLNITRDEFTEVMNTLIYFKKSDIVLEMIDDQFRNIFPDKNDNDIIIKSILLKCIKHDLPFVIEKTLLRLKYIQMTLDEELLTELLRYSLSQSNNEILRILYYINKELVSKYILSSPELIQTKEQLDYIKTTLSIPLELKHFIKVINESKIVNENVLKSVLNQNIHSDELALFMKNNSKFYELSYHYQQVIFFVATSKSILKNDIINNVISNTPSATYIITSEELYSLFNYNCRDLINDILTLTPPNCDIKCLEEALYNTNSLFYDEFNNFYQYSIKTFELLERQLNLSEINRQLAVSPPVNVGGLDRYPLINYSFLSFVKNGLIECTIYFLKNYKKHLTNNIISKAIDESINTGNIKILEEIIKSFPSHHDAIYNFAKECITGLYHQRLDILLKYHREAIINNNELVSLAQQSNFPLVLNKLKENGMVLSNHCKEKLSELEAIAKSITESYSQPTSYSRPIIDYNKNTLNQTQQYINDIIAIVCYAIRHNQFHLDFTHEIDLGYLGKMLRDLSKLNGIKLYSSVAIPRQSIAIPDGSAHGSTLALNRIDGILMAEFFKETAEKLPGINYFITNGIPGVDCEIYINHNDNTIKALSFFELGNGGILLSTCDKEDIDTLLASARMQLLELTKPNNYHIYEIKKSFESGISHLNWLLAQASPYFNAIESANINEIITKSICLIHGMKITFSNIDDCSYYITQKALMTPFQNDYNDTFTQLSKITLIAPSLVTDHIALHNPLLQEFSIVLYIVNDEKLKILIDKMLNEASKSAIRKEEVAQVMKSLVIHKKFSLIYYLLNNQFSNNLYSYDIRQHAIESFLVKSFDTNLTEMSISILKYAHDHQIHINDLIFKHILSTALSHNNIDLMYELYELSKDLFSSYIKTHAGAIKSVSTYLYIKNNLNIMIEAEYFLVALDYIRPLDDNLMSHIIDENKNNNTFIIKLTSKEYLFIDSLYYPKTFKSILKLIASNNELKKEFKNNISKYMTHDYHSITSDAIYELLEYTPEMLFHNYFACVPFGLDLKKMATISTDDKDPRELNKTLDLFQRNSSPALSMIESVLSNTRNAFDSLELKTPNINNTHPIVDYTLISVVRNGHKELINYILTHHLNYLSTYFINRALDDALHSDNISIFEQIVKLLPSNHPSIRVLAERCITGIYHKRLDILLTYHAKELAKDPDMIKLAQKTHFYQTAETLMRYGIFIGNECKERLEQIHNNTNLLSDKKTVIDHESGSIYHKNITQEQYEKYINELSSIVCYALKNNIFELSFTNETTHSDNIYHHSNSSMTHFFNNRSAETSHINLTYLGKIRGDIAILSGSELPSNFGIPRQFINIAQGSSFSTPISKRYQNYYKEFIFNLTTNYDKSVFNTYDYCASDGSFCIRGAIRHKINGKDIILTTYLVLNKDIGSGILFPAWEHTQTDNIPIILKHASKLINQITSQPINNLDNNQIQNVISEIAKIHWYLAHATPYFRGSAAITEIIIKGICLYHGLSIEWNAMPDCKALIQPNIDEYARQYTIFSRINTLAPTQTHNLTDRHNI